MTTYFTSDTHFSHKNIIHLGDGRPFKDIEEHNEMIVRNFNSVLTPDDTLIHLGDVALGPWPDGLSYVKRLLAGNKILVPGNHDRVSSVEKPARRERFLPDYLEAFDVVWPEVASGWIDEKHNVQLSHYPYTGESLAGRPDRYTELRPVNDGRVLIHGHTHANDVVSFDNDTLMISVGVDAWDFHPVSEHAISEIIRDNA